MRLILILAWTTVVFAFIFGQSGADSLTRDSQNAAALLMLEQQWLENEHDPDFENQVLADDFIHALPIGFINKADQIAFDRAHKQPASRVTRHFEDMHARIYGTAGIVNGIVVVNGPDAKEISRTVFTDVFAYRDGRWRAVNSQENAHQPR